MTLLNNGTAPGVVGTPFPASGPAVLGTAYKATFLGDVEASVDIAGAVAGNCEVQLQVSPDGSTGWVVKDRIRQAGVLATNGQMLQAGVQPGQYFRVITTTNVSLLSTVTLNSITVYQR